MARSIVQDKWTLAMLLYNLGDVANHQGHFERARTLAEEEVTLCQESGDNRGIVWALEIMARAAASQGNAGRASRLGGAADALMEMIGVQLPPTLRGPHERYLGSVRAALGDESFAAAWAAGRTMRLPQILAYALARDEGLETFQWEASEEPNASCCSTLPATWLATGHGPPPARGGRLY